MANVLSLDFSDEASAAKVGFFCVFYCAGVIVVLKRVYSNDYSNSRIFDISRYSNNRSNSNIETEPIFECYSKIESKCYFFNFKLKNRRISFNLLST